MTAGKRVDNYTSSGLLLSDWKPVNLTIRFATADDYQACCLLLDQVDALHRDNVPHVYRRSPTGAVRDHGHWTGLVTNDRVGILVAEESRNLIGLVQVMLQESPPVPILVPRRFAVVDTLVVDHRQRRQGIARQLMAAAENWAAHRKAEHMELTVLEFNSSALAFYEELQYETLSRKMSKALSQSGRVPERENCK
jgi:ribosomal protein S18 acetylase RimI-like enzyme